MTASGARASMARGRTADYVEPKETKTYTKTSEFWVLVATAAAIVIAMLTVDEFGPNTGWTLIAVLSSAYMLSRGIAKSGGRKSDAEGTTFGARDDARGV